MTEITDDVALTAAAHSSDAVLARSTRITNVLAPSWRTAVLAYVMTLAPTQRAASVPISSPPLHVAVLAGSRKRESGCSALQGVATLHGSS